MAVERAIPFDYQCLNRVALRTWSEIINSYLSLLALALSLVLPGCTGRVTVSNVPSINTAEATIATPSNPINSLVNTTVISGTCKVSSFELMATSSSGGSSVKVADVICGPNGTYSVTADLSSLPDGNIALTLRESATGRILGATSVAKDTIPPITTALSPPPSLNGLTTISTNVDPADTAHYSFEIGAQSAIDCALDAGYSPATPVATAINENIALIPDGPIRLCLRGQDSAGNWQTTATVLDWVKDTSVSTAILSGFPSSVTNVAAASGTVAGTGVTHYRMKFGLAASTDCALSGGYGPETAVATGVSVTAASGDGLYKLCVIGKNAVGNWQEVANATVVSWPFDSTAPTLTITAPAASSFISPANQASLALTVSCSENARTVSATATSSVDSSQATGSGTCSGGSVNVTLNVSTLPEGGVALSASQTDAASNSGTSASVALTKDTQAPTLAGSLADGSYVNSLATSPTLTWSTASDAGSGIAKYQIAIGTSSGGTQVLAWTDVGNVTSYQASGLLLSDATTYYPQVRAVDAAGNASSAVIGDGWITDTTAPSFPTISFTMASDDWSTTQSPVLNWSAATDSGSGISRYEISIGTVAGLSDVKEWTSIGNVTSATITGLTLTRGVTYFASLRAIDVAGNTSPSIINGDGWLVNHELWITEGSANAIVKSGNTIYLGGSFTKVAPWTGSAVPVSASDGSISWPNPTSPVRLSGLVNVAIPDGNGGYYAAGWLGPIKSVARGALVHIKSDGSLDTAFNPNAGPTIYSLLLSGSTLYVGGSFTTLGGGTRSNLAAISAIDGTLISSFSADTDGAVRALAVSGSKLLVGGDFTTIGGTSQKGLAAVSASTGALDSTFQAPVDSTVHALAISGSTLYVGGDFTTIKGVSLRCLAAVSVSDGTVDTSFNLSPQATVKSFWVSGSTLFVGGIFTSIGGLTRSGLAAVSLSTGGVDPAFAPELNSPYVTSIVVSGSIAYFAGGFSAVNGTTRKNVAAVSIVDGSTDPSFNPDPSGTVFSITLSGSRLILAGSMNSIGGVSRTNLAAISAIDGSAISSFNAGDISGTISALALSDSNLYIGGSFTSVGGTTRNYIAAVSATDGSLVTGFNPGANAAVSTLAVSNSTLYLGGSFTTVAGTARNYIAAVSTSNGSLNAGFNPNANAAVKALLVSSSTVYLGGSFTTVGGTTRNRIAAVLTSNGSLVSTFNPNANNTVNCLALSGSTLYLGGLFTTVGGQTHTRVAAVSTADGTANASFTASANNAVNSLLVSGSTLYLGGAFTTINAVNLKYLAAVSTTNGAMIASFLPGSNGTVNSLALTPSALYAGNNNSQGIYDNPYFSPFRPDTGASLPGD